MDGNFVKAYESRSASGVQSEATQFSRSTNSWNKWLELFLFDLYVSLFVLSLGKKE